jgi:hypothetical protein
MNIEDSYSAKSRVIARTGSRASNGNQNAIGYILERKIKKYLSENYYSNTEDSLNATKTTNKIERLDAEKLKASYEVLTSSGLYALMAFLQINEVTNKTLADATKKEITRDKRLKKLEDKQKRGIKQG